ncbi:MAG TPA: oxygenase MpaB family protein [Frankiaceae bacterium]|nr:oxygenase MpaB family protein [Frankiaceae bacterium]
MGDPGLFGPDSLTWRIHADPVMGIGGLRALHLQALHPLAMAGVAQHSDFRTDPWGRLMRTVGYVTTVSFGSTAQAERAAARVRGIHAPLGGVEPESGTPYRVADPALLRWVHCCLVDSFLTAYRRAGGPLTDAEADAYVAEQVRAAELVGIDPADVPGGTAALAAYFDAIRPELRATAEARKAARFVLNPPMPTRAMAAAKPAWAAVAGTAFALLPRWARRMYGLPGAPPADLAATATLRALRASLLLVPAHVREGPPVRDARARVEDRPPDGRQPARRRLMGEAG